MVDRDLTHALIAKAQGFRERAPVYPITPVPAEQQLRRASVLASILWDLRGDCGPRLTADTSPGVATMLLPEGGRVNVFLASGAIDATIVVAESRPPITDDERKADRPAIYAQLRKIAMSLAKHFMGDEEELRPESVWETKGRGVTLRNEQSPVALFQAVAAFRRYVHGLPVLGRASVHTGFSGANALTKWGVDWRAREKEPMVEADVVDPAEGAKRIMADVQTRQPEHSLTLEDFEPERMTLGYLSMPRRHDQRVLQPAWVAQFRPRRATMGMVVAVPAAPAPFEAIALPGRISWHR